MSETRIRFRYKKLYKTHLLLNTELRKALWVQRKQSEKDRDLLKQVLSDFDIYKSVTAFTIEQIQKNLDLKE